MRTLTKLGRVIGATALLWTFVVENRASDPNDIYCLKKVAENTVTLHAKASGAF